MEGHQGSVQRGLDMSILMQQPHSRSPPSCATSAVPWSGGNCSGGRGRGFPPSYISITQPRGCAGGEENQGSHMCSRCSCGSGLPFLAGSIPGIPSLHKSPFLCSVGHGEAALTQGWECPAADAISAEEPCVGMPAFPGERQSCFISLPHRKNNKHSSGLFSGCFVE